jgi:hypothetical protein
MRRSDRRTVAFAVIALSYAGLSFAVQMFGRGTGGLDPDVHGFRLNGARYVLLPVLMGTTVILALVDAAPDRLHDSVLRWSRRAALLWIAAVLAVNYSRRPRWDRELAHARGACAAPGRQEANVLVAPSPPRVWFATIPCNRIRAVPVARSRPWPR